MIGQPKKKVNLTIDEDVLAKAKRLVEHRGESLSSLVEDFLSRITHDASLSEDNWLTAFHKKHLPKNYREPTDKDIKKLREERLLKHL